MGFEYQQKKLKASVRRLLFELAKSLGLLYLLNKLNIELKDPYKRMYKRYLKKQEQ